MLAVAAAIVTFQKDPKAPERAFWIFLFSVLMIGEIWMVSIDREASEKSQEKTNTQQKEDFLGIANGIRQAISDNNDHFEATITSMNTVLLNLTGGDSFAYLRPEVLGVTPDGYLTFAIDNNGGYPLTGVTVSIVRIQNLNLVNPDSYIGTLSPHERRMTHILIRPDFSATDGIDTYEISLAAQNHAVSQILHIRKSKDLSLRYAVRYWVIKQIPRIKNGKVAGFTQAWAIKPTRWTDEPKEHK